MKYKVFLVALVLFMQSGFVTCSGFENLKMSEGLVAAIKSQEKEFGLSPEQYVTKTEAEFGVLLRRLIEDRCDGGRVPRQLCLSMDEILKLPSQALIGRFDTDDFYSYKVKALATELIGRRIQVELAARDKAKRA